MLLNRTIKIKTTTNLNYNTHMPNATLLLISGMMGNLSFLEHWLSPEDLAVKPGNKMIIKKSCIVTLNFKAFRAHK